MINNQFLLRTSRHNVNYFVKAIIYVTIGFSLFHQCGSRLKCSIHIGRGSLYTLAQSYESKRKSILSHILLKEYYNL